MTFPVIRPAHSAIYRRMTRKVTTTAAAVAVVVGAHLMIILGLFDFNLITSVSAEDGVGTVRRLLGGSVKVGEVGIPDKIVKHINK
jgi:hypothetical protein